MDTAYKTTLELDKVLNRAVQLCACQETKEMMQALEPAPTIEDERYDLTQTNAINALLIKNGSPRFGSVREVRRIVAHARKGGILSMGELLEIAATLRNFSGLSQWYGLSEHEMLPTDDLFFALAPQPVLEKQISESIISPEEMADTASVTLHDLRRKIRQTEDSIRTKLDNIIRNSTTNKFLQDAVVSLRNGRYVVPVRAEYRGEVGGVIHDVSSTGATVFVEPTAVVEANARIMQLRAQEQEEITRILTSFSTQVGSLEPQFTYSYDAMLKIDLLLAKARLAVEQNAFMPAVSDTVHFKLNKARHPLIDKKKVVPVDIELGSEYDTLVITGPNTGGKTVSLKTAGLLTLMTMCGLMIPAADGSEVSIFDHVLADIGDEQSIEQSLSTFSAHMTNIIRILNIADDKSLILIDELGAGTDPVEGAALAISTIEAMRTKGTRVMATTHYAELKAYAIQTVGVENACCEFDVATLRPTYRLLIGVPGRSNAFAISARLGMPANIVEHAKELVSDESTMFEEVVSRLEESRRKMEDERESAEQLRLKAQNMEKEAEALRDRAEKDAKHEIERARMEAAELVQKTRREAQSLLDELEDLRRNKQKLLTAEQKARLKAGIRDMEKASDPVHERRIDEDYVLPRPLQVGDTVLIYDIDKIATVLDVPKNGDQILVQAGIIKTRVPLKNLRLTDQKPREKKKAAGGHRTVTKKMDSAPARNEVDVRGMNLEEALMEVDAFIDHALMHNLNMLTIIHGKGTGILRNGIQQHLRRHKAVKSFRLGVYGEGESGVTIVELK